jgi:hypothetical protein
VKFATSIEGVGTGERGDRVLLDDPHNVIKIDSQGVMEKTIAFFRTSMSRGANDNTGYKFTTSIRASVWREARRAAFRRLFIATAVCASAPNVSNLRGHLDVVIKDCS